MQNVSRSVLLAASISALFLFDSPLSAQAMLDLEHVHATDRVRSPIDEDIRVTLAGSRHSMARPEFDAGRMAADAPMERIQLLLQPDDSQQEALEALIAAQQDSQSPYYHQWLSPDEFGRRFGISDNDLHAVVNWLASKGFLIEPIPASRRLVVFSGAAAQVESAFHTEMHTYRVHGQLHHANASDPQIPAALAPVTAGIVSLHDFSSKPLYVDAGKIRLEAGPDYTVGSTHYLVPGDFATIYDLAPLYAASTDGTGYSIAIAGRSNINLSDVQTFRSQFGLPAKTPQVIVNGNDPGIVSGDQDEASLDVEWAGAVARGATVQFVVSASTSASDGIALSSQYIVNQNLAPVMSLSYGECEASQGSAGNQFWNALWQQATAQGISVFVAAGDSGAAGCDDPSASTAVSGQAVNGLCSSPYSTCVGGTEFLDTANPALYWSSNNTSGTGASALSYIPETTWNESSMVSGGSDLWATGGGSSIVYAKPSWQTGNGVPTSNHRYVPDVALAAAGHDGYLVMMNGQFYAFSGTSCAAPSFGGITTLAVARQGARQGNINPILYGLAAQQAKGGTAVFHDVTAGNNSVKGVNGFNAGVGYDPVTGWGSVDGNLLINAWTGSSTSAPSFQFSAPPASTSVTTGAGATLKYTVTTAGGFNAPVALSINSLPSGLTASFSPASIAAPGAGSSTLTLTATSQSTAGVYNNITITAKGGGLSQTIPLAVTVASKCSYTLNPTSVVQSPAAASYLVSVTAPAGCSWTAASNASWISIVSGGSGTASGQLTYSLTANTGAARTGTLTIGGMTFQVLQNAASTNFSLSPASASAGSSGGTSIVGLTAPASNSTWTAKSNVSWITIAAASASGSGSANVSYTVAPNTATAARTGTLTIAGLTFTVTQAGSSCTDSLSLQSATTAGFTLLVAAPAGCSWTAVSNASWITITSGSSGDGNGTVGVAVSANSSGSSRSGTLTVAGYTVTVTEAATKPSVRTAQASRPVLHITIDDESKKSQ
jgi:pseudomonalisin